MAEALKGNQIMTELSISDNHMTYNGMSGVIAISNAIPTMGALAKLDISNNCIPSDQQANLKGICTSKSIDLTL